MAARKAQKATDARVMAALRKWDGMVSLAARDLGMSRQGLHQRIAAQPELQQFIADLNVQILDTAESQVAKKVRRGDGTTIRWLLDRKGRDRGYGPQAGDLPPPPDPQANERRLTTIRVLVSQMDAKAQQRHAVAVEVQDGPSMPQASSGALRQLQASRGQVLSEKPSR